MSNNQISEVLRQTLNAHLSTNERYQEDVYDADPCTTVPTLDKHVSGCCALANTLHVGRYHAAWYSNVEGFPHKLTYTFWVGRWYEQQLQ